jgi:hypothetical protein
MAFMADEPVGALELAVKTGGANAGGRTAAPLPVRRSSGAN